MLEWLCMALYGALTGFEGRCGVLVPLRAVRSFWGCFCAFYGGACLSGLLSASGSVFLML